MRAFILVTILGLAGFASAAFTSGACTQGGVVTANAALCTDTAITAANGPNGVALAVGNPGTCNSGYYVQANNAKTATSCVAVSNGCSQNAPNIAGATATAATVPVVNTCAASQNTPTGASDVGVSPAPTAAQVVCNNPTGAADATKTYYTPSSATTAAGGAFTATPINTWLCYACPTGCVDCTPASGKTPNPATPQSGCKTAGTGYFLSTGIADVTSGLQPICPGTIPAANANTANYGGNATACTACNGANNCTAATCPANNVYISIANTTGMGNQTLASQSYNVGALPYTASGPYVGCYSTAYLSGLISAAQSSSNNTNGSTTSASRITVGIAAASAVAAIFAF